MGRFLFSLTKTESPTMYTHSHNHKLLAVRLTDNKDHDTTRNSMASGKKKLSSHFQVTFKNYVLCCAVWLKGSALGAYAVKFR